MKDFILKKKTWRCGAHGEHELGKGDTMLLNDEGYQCCLGQLCSQLGIPNKDILNVDTPGRSNLNKHYNLLVNENLLVSFQEDIEADALEYEWVDEAMDINDSGSLTTKEKIEKLRPLFKKGGYNLIVE